MKNLNYSFRLFVAALCTWAGWATAADLPLQVTGPTNATVLIIRHAEKPATGQTLSPAGELRAQAYAAYFQKYLVGGTNLHLDQLFATADSKNSQRPRRTIEPLAGALHLKIDQRFDNKSSAELAQELRLHGSNHQTLVAWHHGKIAALITALGGDPAQLLPGGEWPAEQFSWVIQLRYDATGHLLPAETRRVPEKLMPGDTD